jgi:serine O-acetyltransferase
MPDLPEPHNWSAVISQLKSDRDRLLGVLSNWGEAGRGGIHLHPSFICVVLYRISHYLFEKRRSLLARLLGQFNELITGAEINPASEIGAGLVVLCPPGTALYGKAGRNLTVMHCAGIGGEIGRRDDVGGGPGLPVLGDDVVLEPHCGILGPQKIGNRVRVGGGTLVVRDIPDDTFVEGPRPRLLARKHLS